ncbi:OmpA family protein [Prosthecobacter sp.]|uniref:OmpA family protein n=1 Tax=Prosthecobacter sp. TaxID=1965333 RepID=UPI003783C77E
MKSHLSALLFLLPALPFTTASAQRESFDATTTRKAEITIIEVLAPPPSGSALREGRIPGGGTARLTTSKKSVTFDNIFFKFDSAELRDRASELLIDDIAAALKSPKLKDARFLIEGHTCDLGEDAYNLDLSAQRADTIRRLLIKRGISAQRLVALGFGETEIVDPVKSGDTAAEAETRRMKSRRVVLRRILPEKAAGKK